MTALPYCRVSVEGQEITDLVHRCELDESDELADQARLTLGDANLVLSDVLHEGLAIEIDLGRDDEHAIVFRGVVTGVEAHFPSHGSATLDLTAADSLILLSLKAQTKRWWNTTVSQIVSDIAVANGLRPGTIAPVHDEQFDDARPAQQVIETDLAFLQRLARLYDAKLYIDHGEPTDTLNLVATTSLMEAEPIDQMLVFNGNMSDFRVAFDSSATATEQSLVSTDPQTGEVVELSERIAESGEASWTPDPGRVALGGGDRLAGLLGQSAAKRAALTDYWRVPARVAAVPARPSSDGSRTFGDRARKLGQRGRGRTTGNIWLRPRKRVRIEGYGGRWSGPWYLAGVRHVLDLDERDFVTSFTCTR
jgi:hypothetical protein